MKKRIVLLILVLIFSVGIFLRLYNLKNKGIFFYDEGIYLCSAKAKYQILKNAFYQKDFNSALDGIAKSKPVNFGMGSKIGYVFFVFLSLLIFGPKEYSSFLVSCLSGILTIYLLYIIGRKIYSEKVAFIAALLFSASSMSIMYSRHGLPQAQSVFFLTLSWYLYLNYAETGKINNLFLSGISCGFAITTHYNLMIFSLIFILFEIIKEIKNKKRLVLNVFLYIISVVIPFIFWQFVTLLDRKLGWGLFPLTFFQELKGSLFAIGEQANKGVDPFFSLYYFQKMEGWMVFLSFILGTYFLIKRLKKRFDIREFTLLSLAYFAVIWFGFYPHLRVLRSFLVTLPAMHLISAKFLYDFVTWKKMKKIRHFSYGLILSWIIFFCILNSWPIVNFKSSYRECVDYLIKENKLKLATDQMEMYPVWCYYLGEEVVPVENFNIIESLPPQVKTLVNIWSYDKSLEGCNLSPEKIFYQVSFSAFNAEGGTKDKYLIKNVPQSKIDFYDAGELRSK